MHSVDFKILFCLLTRNILTDYENEDQENNIKINTPVQDNTNIIANEDGNNNVSLSNNKKFKNTKKKVYGKKSKRVPAKSAAKATRVSNIPYLINGLSPKVKVIIISKREFIL